MKSLNKTIIGIEKIHELELGILEEIDRICKKNDITYYLQAGSVLGAIRHNGFIPWDTDADVIIPANKYLKFEEECRNNLNKRFKVYTCQDKEHPVYFMRMSLSGQEPLCAYVDIFILAGVPSGVDEQKQFIRKSYILNLLRTLRFVSVNKKDSFFKNSSRIIFRFLSRLIPIRLINNLFFKHCLNVPFDKAEYVMNPCGKYGVRNLFKKEIYGVPQIVKFEHLLLPIPNKFEPYLIQYYKDYMKFPPQSIIEKGLNYKSIYINHE